MPLRNLRLPADLRVAARLIPLAFQYPDNEAWSVQSDEEEELVDILKRTERLWPLIRPIRSVSPTLRNMLRGLIWEEDDRPVGMAYFYQFGPKDIWYIMALAVLPAYRGRGIGRKLACATLDSIREHDGRVALLDVIDGNVPAYNLYEQLGFEHFTGDLLFDYNQDKSPPELPLPKGYEVSMSDFLDWRAEYELARRITPAHILKYRPIEKATYRRPQFLRPFIPVIQNTLGMHEGKTVIRASIDRQIIALGEHIARTRPGGVNYINLQLDPAHPELALYLVHKQIRILQQSGPERRIKIRFPVWQGMLSDAAVAAGCVKRLEYHRMGVML